MSQVPVSSRHADAAAAPRRLTPARARVLAVLHGATHALSHHEIEQALAAEAAGALDRVTVYRALDWLGEQGLVMRTTDGERVFRFTATGPAAVRHERHAHFECGDCGRVFCLEDVAPPVPDLPAGFSSAQVSLSVRGRCGECGVRVAHAEGSEQHE